MFDRLTLLNNVDRSKKAPFVTPRDAASLIVIDRRNAPYKLLMGLRHQKSSFMPDVYVFPGGGLDRADDLLAEHATSEYPSELLSHIKKFASSSSSSKGAGLALCALRELFEETGLHLANNSTEITSAEINSTNISSLKHPYSEVPFDQLLQNFVFLSRAITPPGRSKRYDTRFFLHDFQGGTLRQDDKDNELIKTCWVNYQEAINLKIHPMTRVILEDLNDHLCGHDPLIQPSTVAYYHYVNDSFQIERLEL